MDASDLCGFPRHNDLIEISGRFLYNESVRRKKQQRHDPEKKAERAERNRSGTSRNTGGADRSGRPGGICG